MSKKSQKNYRKIPDFIRNKLETIRSNYIRVTTLLNINLNSPNDQNYNNLFILNNQGEFEFPSVLSPDKLRGSYSKKNLNGYTIIHKDLPKISKTYIWEAPNFGDPTKGYHDVIRHRLIYPRTHIAPREWSIRLESLTAGSSNIYTLKASIDIILNKEDPGFETDLLFAINLLQENVYACDVHDANTTDDQYIATRVVDWQIFPPGQKNQLLAAIGLSVGSQNLELTNKITDRINYIESLNPREYIVGQGMNRNYIGAKFRDDLIIFENIHYGNAIYILFDNWQQLSQMSRIDIIQRSEKDFDRIFHRNGWKETLRYKLFKYLSLE